MTILDAYAVLAFLRDERAADEVRLLMEAGDAVLTSMGLGEVFDYLVRPVGADEEEAALDLAEPRLLDACPVPASVGAAAGRLHARHYHRTRCAVSMADCIAAETARSRAEPLATSDPRLLDVCERELIDVIVLRGLDGSRWAART